METTQKTYTVKGMTCEGCVNAVKNILSNTEGVQEAEVNLESQQANITFDESKTGFENLKKSVQRIGYDLVNENA